MVPIIRATSDYKLSPVRELTLSFVYARARDLFFSSFSIYSLSSPSLSKSNFRASYSVFIFTKSASFTINSSSLTCFSNPTYSSFNRQIHSLSYFFRYSSSRFRGLIFSYNYFGLRFFWTSNPIYGRGKI